ncbi:unnamed protein product [Lactuca saligna]|uniref:Uncharacterized protein n=1 Tax=Lactuca saligna TaxID=75948 RepID=A0AA35Y5K3_LACSI|nr:unnamed protein product [Lactuca saligna]
MAVKGRTTPLHLLKKKYPKNVEQSASSTCPSDEIYDHHNIEDSPLASEVTRQKDVTNDPSIRISHVLSHERRLNRITNRETSFAKTFGPTQFRHWNLDRSQYSTAITLFIDDLPTRHHGRLAPCAAVCATTTGLPPVHTSGSRSNPRSVSAQYQPYISPAAMHNLMYAIPYQAQQHMAYGSMSYSYMNNPMRSASSNFNHELLQYEIPHTAMILNMPKYDNITDPDDHIDNYEWTMTSLKMDHHFTCTYFPCTITRNAVEERKKGRQLYDGMGRVKGGQSQRFSKHIHQTGGGDIPTKFLSRRDKMVTNRNTIATLGTCRGVGKVPPTTTIGHASRVYWSWHLVSTYNHALIYTEYNILLGRPALFQLRAIFSTLHEILKFSTSGRREPSRLFDEQNKTLDNRMKHMIDRCREKSKCCSTCWTKEKGKCECLQSMKDKIMLFHTKTGGGSRKEPQAIKKHLEKMRKGCTTMTRQSQRSNRPKIK